MLVARDQGSSRGHATRCPAHVQPAGANATDRMRLLVFAISAVAGCAQAASPPPNDVRQGSTSSGTERVVGTFPSEAAQPADAGPRPSRFELIAALTGHRVMEALWVCGVRRPASVLVTFRGSDGRIGEPPVIEPMDPDAAAFPDIAVECARRYFVDEATVAPFGDGVFSTEFSPLLPHYPYPE